jgi:plastocyanin
VRSAAGFARDAAIVAQVLTRSLQDSFGFFNAGRVSADRELETTFLEHPMKGVSIMRRLLFLFFIVTTLGVASAGVAAAPTSVSITSKGFNPNNVTVAAGETVTWTNSDASKHQVVADDGSFSSPVLAAKQSYSHAFPAGGTFDYRDSLHPSLKGNVTVIPVRTVWITSAGFQPSTIAIQTGQSVKWVNKSSANQQVLADDASFASLVLTPGSSYSHTFSTAGTYGYRNGLQPSQKGTVVVTSPPPGEALTLTSDTTLVTYGDTLTLRGRVANGTPGEKVTVTGHPQASLNTTKAIQTQTATAGPDGSFTVDVKPLVHTVYVAETAKSRSDPLAIDVRPRLRLARISRARAIVRVSAARNFVHKYVLLQAYRSRAGLWLSVARVRLTVATNGVSPTVTTSAVFRLHLRHGLRLRVLMPLSQAAPGYASSTSNTIRS